MKPLLLAAALAAAASPGPEALVDEAESALWDDHADVRDACFLLRRAGIEPAELDAALRAPAEGADPSLRRRARRLRARLGACATPSNRARARCAEGLPGWPSCRRRP